MTFALNLQKTLKMIDKTVT